MPKIISKFNDVFQLSYFVKHPVSWKEWRIKWGSNEGLKTITYFGYLWLFIFLKTKMRFVYLGLLFSLYVWEITSQVWIFSFFILLFLFLSWTVRPEARKDGHIVQNKVLMQGKLIAVAYTLRTYWNQFSVGGLCKQK